MLIALVLRATHGHTSPGEVVEVVSLIRPSPRFARAQPLLRHFSTGSFNELYAELFELKHAAIARARSPEAGLISRC